MAMGVILVLFELCLRLSQIMSTQKLWNCLHGILCYVSLRCHHLELYDVLCYSSVEEHLQKCGSDASITEQQRSRRLSRSKPKALMLETNTTQSDYMDDLSDVSSDESLEISNPFGALGKVDSVSDRDEEIEQDLESVVSENSTSPKQRLKFYQQDSLVEEDGDSEESETKARDNNQNNEFMKDISVAKDTDYVTSEDVIAIETVKKFSGLDKATVIGINPYVNEEHADFKKFVLNLATRAKDNLIIITTSDNIKQKLDTFLK